MATIPAVLEALRTRDLLDVLDEVCRRRHVTRADLCGRRRTRAAASARQEIWWLLRHHPELHFSFADIGRLFGRDHTTIMAGVGAHERRRGPPST
jgi:chromosomal replication initiation ATPase DnaA